jgi:FkbM family methyltransferase
MSVWGRIKRAREQRRIERALAVPRLMRAFARRYPNAFFVEIGANDGEQHDHLREFILSRRLRWRGVMVEPVPYVFERLRANYGEHDRVALENAAIADRDGARPFYYVVDADASERTRLPDWYDGIGSFSREKVLAHRKAIPDIDRRLMERELPCMTFDTLCRRHDAVRVDLLVIDTEGYEAEILRSIDLRAWAPRVILYEHFHLLPDDRARSRARLEEAGYETLEEGFDTLCLRPDGGDSLDRCWQHVEPAFAGVSVQDEH